MLIPKPASTFSAQNLSLSPPSSLSLTFSPRHSRVRENKCKFSVIFLHPGLALLLLFWWFSNDFDFRGEIDFERVFFPMGKLWIWVDLILPFFYCLLLIQWKIRFYFVSSCIWFEINRWDVEDLGLPEKLFITCFSTLVMFSAAFENILLMVRMR